MIKYQNVSNELVFETKIIPQNCGEISEQIDIDNYDSSCRYFLELECPKKIKFISEEIVFSGNVGSITLPNIITSNVGKIFIQLIIRDANGEVISKSLKSTIPLFKIEESINAVRDLSNEKVSDCIAYIIQSVSQLNEIKSTLETKLKNGEFNGKDGTIINVDGVEQKKISFISNPQTQLDTKANRQEVNELSMCFSNKYKENIFGNPSTWSTPLQNFVASSNGYITVSFKTKNNIQLENCMYGVLENNLLAYGVSATPFSYTREYVMSMPVKKGMTVQLIVIGYDNILPESFTSVFVYAEGSNVI